jgi:putative chitinase
MDIDVATLRAIAPRARSGLVGPIASACAKWLDRYEINTPLRVAHFLAQAAHETAGFTTLEELGGRSYFAKYDAGTPIGKRLGNTQPGDGCAFRGRGVFQCTGRANYALYGKRLKLDLVADPELAAEPDTSVRIACEYWKAKGLNAWADRDDVGEVTRRINGGTNGLAERTKMLARAKGALDDHAAPLGLLSDGGADASADDDVPDAPIAAEPPKSWLASRINQAAAGIGSVSIYGLYEQAKDFAYNFTDNPVEISLYFAKAHPAAVIVTLLAGYIIWTRIQMLREAR